MALMKKPVNGMKDILPEEMQIRDYVIGIIKETYRRRAIQLEYNEKNNIIPQTIKKEIRNVLEITSKEKVNSQTKDKQLSKAEKKELIIKSEFGEFNY